ncbi:MAG TPA: PRC-barrel domain-containing protein, partial [Actinomycetes bacterium]|nr:PRC-barrel domain-containing protein [Actinomycetes bacterium]
MAAFDPATLDRWRALAIVDRDGTTVGTVSEFYLDRETGHPTWALVNIGLFGSTRTFVPLVHAIEIGDGLQVPYEKRHIKDSPHIDPHDQLTPDEEAILFTHYGVEYRPSTDPEPGVAGSPGSGPGATGSVESTGAVAPEAGSAGPTEAVPAEPTEVVDPAGGAPGSGKPTEATPADPEPADLRGGAPDPDQPPGAAPA